MGIVVRQPVVTRLARPEHVQATITAEGSVWSNRLLDLLKGKDTFFSAPGAGPTYDWPNPRGPLRANELLTFTNSVKLNLLSKDQFFTSAGRGPTYDWPNPPGPRYASDLRTFVNPLEPNLLSKDKFFGAAGQPPANLDWPVPKGPVPSIVLKTWTWDDVLLNVLKNQDQFFGLAGNPTWDWPVPKGPVPATTLKTWVDPVKLTLIGQDRFFGLAGNPTFDWPVPKEAAPGVVTQRTWAEGYKLLLFRESIPALNFDWPVPRGPRASLQAGSRGSLLGTLLAILQAPFALLDWPNPLGPRFPSDLRTFLNAVETQLVGQDQFFGAPGQVLSYDWPLPGRRIPAVDLLTWIRQGARMGPGGSVGTLQTLLGALTSVGGGRIAITGSGLITLGPVTPSFAAIQPTGIPSRRGFVLPMIKPLPLGASGAAVTAHANALLQAITVLHQRLDAVDSLLARRINEMMLSGPISTRPAPGIQDRLFIATDQAPGANAYYDTGSAWIAL